MFRVDMAPARGTIDSERTREQRSVEGHKEEKDGAQGALQQLRRILEGHRQ